MCICLTVKLLNRELKYEMRMQVRHKDLVKVQRNGMHYYTGKLIRRDWHEKKEYGVVI
ncbi:hypothetical protein HanPSC8_Chr16g0732161 [Helianthus annuus]|nr:hypothetical protein HanPSC8_Chr16g0732161 [Helianthus annuus]